jgi:hypothetical protein
LLPVWNTTPRNFPRGFWVVVAAEARAAIDPPNMIATISNTNAAGMRRRRYPAKPISTQTPPLL